MSECSIIGIDLAKNHFHVHGANRRGRELFSRKLSRAKLSSFILKQKPCRIAMEACSGAHFWARKFLNMGHEVVLIAPQFVKPYVKGDKSDSADAEAICEAASRENMRFVPVKTRTAQDLCSLTRIRDLCVKNTTALSNQIRGLLAEYGVVAPKGKSALRTLLAQLSDVNISSINEQEWGDLTPVMVCELSQLYEELCKLDEKVTEYGNKIEKLARQDDRFHRLIEIPGIGPLTAATVLGTVADANVFKSGRQFSSWLGLVPRQHSTGGKQVLLSISKRGDGYLRKLLVHGARSVLFWGKGEDYRRRWALSLKERKGSNKAAVALANRNARVIWALLTKGERYDPNYISMAA